MSQAQRSIAIVGSGPSGFYLAEALERSGINPQIDIFDRLPTPFGLVRGGVAPDHPKIKSISAVFERIAQRPGIRFVGNVEIGRDITVSTLRENYDAVVLAYGAEQDSALGIPGEQLPGSHAAGEFVGWYNGHPSFSALNFDLSSESAVVIGLGNVAADICRILLTPVEELRKTDIADHALEQLGRSRISTVHLIGRRGPSDAKFSLPELRELGEISGCAAVVSLDDLSRETGAPLSEAQSKTLSLLKSFPVIEKEQASKRLHFHFWKSPIEISGKAKVESIQLKNAEDAEETIQCGLVVRCIGFRGVALPGISIDQKTGTMENSNGRVIENGAIIPGLYVCGWLKRGPSGTIGANRADSFVVASEILKDLESLPARAARTPTHLLRSVGLKPVDFKDWKKIDAREIAAGMHDNRPRRKFVKMEDLLKAADK